MAIVFNAAFVPQLSAPANGTATNVTWTFSSALYSGLGTSNTLTATKINAISPNLGSSSSYLIMPLDPAMARTDLSKAYPVVNAPARSFQIQNTLFGNSLQNATLGTGFASSALGTGFASSALGTGFASSALGTGFAASALGTSFASSILGTSYANAYEETIEEDLAYASNVECPECGAIEVPLEEEE